MTDDQFLEIRPSTVGDDSNLPPDVRAVAGLQSPVVAWTTVDLSYERDLERYSPTSASAFICFPLSLCSIGDRLTYQNTFWILTVTELKIVVKNHEEFCLTGIKQSGDHVRTIPLDKIISCGVKPTKRVPYLPHVYVDTSPPIELKDGTLQHAAVGFVLIGRDWFAQEILHLRDMLQPTDNITGSTISAPSVSRAAPPVLQGASDDNHWATAQKYSPLASFGHQDNAPHALLKWAHEHQQHILAWTTLDPADCQDKGVYVLFRTANALLWLPLVLFVSVPMALYMVFDFRLDGWVSLRWLFRAIPGSLLVYTVALCFVGAVNVFRRTNQTFRDNYWVVTETHLCVLSKRDGLAIKRNIPLSIITQCSTTTRGSGRLDKRGASLPEFVIYTSSEEELKCSARGVAVAENEWFVQQVLSQRESVTRHVAA
jgi:hypothetical protein